MSPVMTPPRAWRLKSYLWQRLLRIEGKYSPPPYRPSLRLGSPVGVQILPFDLDEVMALKVAYDHYVRLLILLEDKLRRSQC